MPDGEKVIDGLEELRAWLKHLQTVGFHGDIPEYRERELAVSDALTLLREQEPIAPKQPVSAEDPFALCGHCGNPLASDMYKYCPWCGRKVKWNEQD